MELCLFDSPDAPDGIASHRAAGEDAIRSGTAICRTRGRDRSTATASTDRTNRRAGIASIRARCCSIPTRRRSRASCAGTTRCSIPMRDTAHCAPLARVVDTAFRLERRQAAAHAVARDGRLRAARQRLHQTASRRAGETARHLRGPRVARGDRASARARRHRGRAAPGALSHRRAFPRLARPRELLGLQHARLSRARSALRRERTGGRGAGVPGDGARSCTRPASRSSSTSFTTTPPRATNTAPRSRCAGIDNAAYYRLADDRARYVDFTGCGNSLNVAHPRTLQLIMDSLRHWVLEMHVDGFRFDLASALARELWEVDRLGSFFDIIHQDPVLSEVKLIAEPWDLGPNGYQVGNFPVLWSEWNGKYRDCVRRFWKGNGGTVGELASRLAGSSDLYRAQWPPPEREPQFHHRARWLHAARSRQLQRTSTTKRTARRIATAATTTTVGTAAPKARRTMPRSTPCARGSSAISSPRCSSRKACRCSSPAMNSARRSTATTTPIARIRRSRGSTGTLRRTARAARFHARAACACARRSPSSAGAIFSRAAPIHGAEIKDLYWLKPDGTEMTDADWNAGHARCLGMVLARRSDHRDGRARRAHRRRHVRDSLQRAPRADRVPPRRAPARCALDVRLRHRRARRRQPRTFEHMSVFPLQARSLALLRAEIPQPHDMQPNHSFRPIQHRQTERRRRDRRASSNAPSADCGKSSTTSPACAAPRGKIIASPSSAPRASSPARPPTKA